MSMILVVFTVVYHIQYFRFIRLDNDANDIGTGKQNKNHTNHETIRHPIYCNLYSLESCFLHKKRNEWTKKTHLNF